MWTGQRYDPGVELYAFVYRTYSPQLGRWLQRDPLGYTDSMNLQEYVAGRAGTMMDPLGLVMGHRPISVSPGMVAPTAVGMAPETPSPGDNIRYGDESAQPDEPSPGEQEPDGGDDGAEDGDPCDEAGLSEFEVWQHQQRLGELEEGVEDLFQRGRDLLDETRRVFNPSADYAADEAGDAASTASGGGMILAGAQAAASGALLVATATLGVIEDIVKLDITNDALPTDKAGLEFLAAQGAEAQRILDSIAQAEDEIDAIEDQLPDGGAGYVPPPRPSTGGGNPHLWPTLP